MEHSRLVKRLKAEWPVLRKAFMPQDLAREEDEGGELLLEVYFQLNFNLLFQLPPAHSHSLARQRDWTSLRELKLCPMFNDHQVDVNAILDLSLAGISLPSLEVLVCQNQPLNRIRLSNANCPSLHTVSLSYPIVPIEMFELHLPNTLRELHVKYAIVHDGRGLSMSSDVNVNPRLIHYVKFATTVFHAGVI